MPVQNNSDRRARELTLVPIETRISRAILMPRKLFLPGESQHVELTKVCPVCGYGPYTLLQLIPSNEPCLGSSHISVLVYTKKQAERCVGMLTIFIQNDFGKIMGAWRDSPRFQELERRLRGRGTESEEAIRKRLANAANELRSVQEPNLFDHVIVNNNVDEAYSQLLELLQLPSRQRQKGSTLPVVVCGPSGVGKGTLIDMLLKESPERCALVSLIPFRFHMIWQCVVAAENSCASLQVPANEVTPS